MSKIKLTGDTSGYVEISAPNVAANNTLELGGGTKILTNLDNVFTGVTTYSGNIDLNANLDLADNNKILIGTGDDLQIYHNGTNSYVLNNTTGDLRIEQAVDDGDIILQADNGSGGQANYLFCDGSSGRVVLSHYGSGKIETSSTGATVTGTLVSGSVTSELDLTAISSSISDTAVDIFVYDTRKDSDGGAWRKRTQHTSWYNETLNTATRGSRKEFPAVAVIVVTAATTRKLYIYDGDDPDLPMWMIIDTNDGQWPQVESSSLHALNGIIALGSSSDSQPLYETRNRLDLYYFVSDKIESSGGAGGSYYGTVDGLVNRRSHAANLGSPLGNSVYPLVNIRVNDVAMTVLPNAPIDDTTGLPIPTIAVATDGGVSVIKDDGTVVDINRTSDDDVHHVDLDGDRVIMFMELGAIYVATIPSVDQSGNPNSAWTVYGSYGANTSGTDHPAVQAYGAGVDLVSMKDHTFATAGFNDSNDLYKGLSILSENLESSGNGMVAYAATSYNTGWMQGDIKGAFLSDTDTTNVTGGNKVTNGDAWSGAQSSTSSTPPTGWTGGNAAQFKTHSGGDGTYIRLVNAGSAQGGPNSYMYQAITTVPGKKYKISLTQYHHATISVYYYVGTSINGNQLTSGTWVSSSGNTPRDEHNTFTATGTTTYLTLGITSGTNNYDTGWDNVIITELVDDRSVNVNGLHSFGTVTKSAVATGADLVAYSGWSSSNYLIQPYNSDLNFGTGDFSTSFWVYTTDANLTGFVFDRGGPNNTDPRIAVYIENDLIVLYTYGSAGRSISHSFDEYENRWVHVVMTRHSSGVMQIFINGTIVSTTTTSVQNVTSSTNPDLIIGHRFSIDGVNALDASIALLRFSASIPSAEQIKKMYEDEKVLFQENAKATLYGSSDAVTALGYDEDTELLHVGTSSGRSDFQGLRRINNTTTAVTTAISASDDLIAEQ